MNLSVSYFTSPGTPGEGGEGVRQVKSLGSTPSPALPRSTGGGSVKVDTSYAAFTVHSIPFPTAISLLAASGSERT